MTSNLNRRHILLGTAAATLMFGTPTLAQSSSQARALIDATVADITRAINSGKSGNALFRDFESIFARYADVPTIARSALGPPARSASSAQMRAFTKAFAGYISRKYGRRFREFEGGKIEVTGARQIKSFQEVRAIARLRGEAPFAVSFMVTDRSGKNRFFDLLIEGISLLKVEKAEIGAILDRVGGDIDKLVVELGKRG